MCCVGQTRAPSVASNCSASSYLSTDSRDRALSNASQLRPSFDSKTIDAMNGKELDGRAIRLDFSQPRDVNGGGRGRGMSFGGGGGRGRGGFDGGRGRGGGRVRHFTLFKALRPDNLYVPGSWQRSWSRSGWRQRRNADRCHYLL